MSKKKNQGALFLVAVSAVVILAFLMLSRHESRKIDFMNDASIAVEVEGFAAALHEKDNLKVHLHESLPISFFTNPLTSQMMDFGPMVKFGGIQTAGPVLDHATEEDANKVDASDPEMIEVIATAEYEKVGNMRLQLAMKRNAEGNWKVSAFRPKLLTSTSSPGSNYE